MWTTSSYWRVICSERFISNTRKHCSSLSSQRQRSRRAQIKPKAILRILVFRRASRPLLRPKKKKMRHLRSLTSIFLPNQRRMLLSRRRSLTTSWQWRNWSIRCASRSSAPQKSLVGSISIMTGAKNTARSRSRRPSRPMNASRYSSVYSISQIRKIKRLIQQLHRFSELRILTIQAGKSHVFNRIVRFFKALIL